MDKGVMKKIRKISKSIFIGLSIFIVSVLFVNILIPAFQKKTSNEYKKAVSEMQFETETVGSERVRCVDDNAEALLWRLRMIGNAEKSIVMATFDLRVDESGKDVMAALHQAAERGVKVKVLIDGIYEKVYLKNNDTFYALCSHENIEVRIYNPVNARNLYRINYRMHDKYLIIDDIMYLLGGRNTTDKFLGEYQRGSNTDRDVLVYQLCKQTDGSIFQLMNYFTRIWEEPCTDNVREALEKKTLEREYKKFAERYQTLRNTHGDFETFDKWIDDTYETNKITLISNDVLAENKEPKVLYAIEKLAEGRSEIIIQTPYVICNRYMYHVLANMEKNADVSIVLNAVEKGSNPWGSTDYLNQKKRIMNTGVTIYELMNPYAVHTKTVLIDHNLSIIGSYNWDMRSTYLDTELMLVIDSEELNAHIRETIEIYKEKSIEVLADGTETIGSQYVKKEQTAGKKVLYGVLRVIIRPFRYLL